MPAACRLAALPHLGAIRVTGADAAEFLAAQLSQAPPGPGARQAPLAAWHDAKGRVQALFRVIRRDADYLLVSHTSVLDEVGAALQRYVLRADVRLEAAGDAAGAALLGDSEALLVDRRVELGTEPGAAALDRAIAWVRLGPMLVHALASAATLEPGSVPRSTPALPSQPAQSPTSAAYARFCGPPSMRTSARRT